MTLCSRGSPEKETKREVVAEPLPLQSRFMMSHGKQKETKKSNLQPFLTSGGSHLPPLAIEPGTFHRKCNVPPTKPLTITEHQCSEVR